MTFTLMSQSVSGIYALNLDTVAKQLRARVCRKESHLGCAGESDSWRAYKGEMADHRGESSALPLGKAWMEHL